MLHLDPTSPIEESVLISCSYRAEGQKSSGLVVKNKLWQHPPTKDITYKKSTTIYSNSVLTIYEIKPPLGFHLGLWALSCSFQPHACA